MEFGGISLGMREAVIGLIAAVAIYMLIVVLRMRRLSRRKVPTAPAGASEAPSLPPESPQAEPGDAWETAPPGLAEDVLRRGVEQELAQLRDEVDAIRGELAALRDDMHHELAHLRATQTVSPLYGDAMQMAAAGYDPAAIAERCGIARAEAELVVALAKNQNPER